jgi:hypothetical protein
VHGMVSLNIRKRCEVILPERKKSIVEDALEEFFNMLDKL